MINHHQESLMLHGGRQARNDRTDNVRISGLNVRIFGLFLR